MLRGLLLALLAAAGAVQPSAGAEMVLRCVTETDGDVSRLVCAPVPVTDEVRVPLPEAPPPLVTDGGAGMPPPLVLPLPEAPAAVVTIPEKDLREARRQMPAPLPPFPVLALQPPTPPAPPAVPAAPVLVMVDPPPPPPPVVIDAMPPEAMRQALRRLRTGDRVGNTEADEAMSFYAARGFQPLWLENGSWNARAIAMRAVFAAAADDGMDPARYRTVAQFVPVGEPQWPALAAAEAQMTEAVLLYARDAAVGRVRPGLVHPLITPRLRHDGADAVLAAVADAADPAQALAAYHPPHPQYAALKAALAAARANRPALAAAGEPIPEGPALRVGMRDARVPLIRERLGMEPDGAPVYDRAVAIKVAGLQKANGLPVNGLFTPQTRRVLAGEAASPEEAEIIANMEFWRWMPRNLGRAHILVNTPAHEMTAVRDGAEVLAARVIVGKSETQTPFFSGEMDHIVVNPSWYIPPGILKREPKYLDPAYAAARGYEIRTRGSITTVRVPPSSSNALGNVKFMFPNEHSVYLHDTPNRGLFGARTRTLSNGCVRVENPMRLAALLFEADGITEERFRRMQGGAEKRMNLPKKMPVHLAYFTLTVGQDGALQRHPDVYGHAARLRQLLALP